MLFMLFIVTVPPLYTLPSYEWSVFLNEQQLSWYKNAFSCKTVFERDRNPKTLFPTRLQPWQSYGPCPRFADPPEAEKTECHFLWDFGKAEKIKLIKKELKSFKMRKNHFIYYWEVCFLFLLCSCRDIEFYFFSGWNLRASLQTISQSFSFVGSKLSKLQSKGSLQTGSSSGL